MGKKGFRELVVWQKAKELAVGIYQLARREQFSRDFNMIDQMRRAALSVCSNIAEGDERGSDKESLRFFYIAKGSLAELATQLEIAKEIGYLSSEEKEVWQEMCSKVANKLGALIKARSRSAIT